jgi:hypothetical protein
MSTDDRKITPAHEVAQEDSLPQATVEETKRRGEAATKFYKELAEQSSKEDFEFRLPPPIGARRQDGVWSRMQRVLYTLFAP